MHNGGTMKNTVKVIHGIIFHILSLVISISSFGCKETTSDTNLDQCLDSEYVWAKSIGGKQIDSIVSISLSPDAQFSYVAGNFEDSVNCDGKSIVSTSASRDGFFAKLDVSGNVVFIKNVGGPGSDAITGIAAGDSNYAYITGHFIYEATFGFVTKRSSSTTGLNFFMSRIEPDGGTIIVHALGGTPTNPTAEAYGERIAWDSIEKKVYVEGMFKGALTATLKDGTKATIVNRTQWKPFTAVFDPSGNWLDLQPTLTQGKPYTTLNTKDKDGYYYETGTFTGTMTKGPGNKTIVSAGKTDGFIIKYCQ